MGTLLRWSLGLLPAPMVVFALLIGGLRGAATGDPAVIALIAAENCQPPCVIGIPIGTTPIKDAVDLLEAHPWVESVMQPRYSGAMTFWTWREDFPLARRIDVVNGTPIEAGGIWGFVGFVTRIPYGEVWGLLGEPDELRLNVVSYAHEPAERVALRFVARYHARGITLISDFLRCPVSRADLWRSPATIAIGQKEPTLFGSILLIEDRLLRPSFGAGLCG